MDIALNKVIEKISFYWLSLLVIGLLITTSASVPLADKLFGYSYYFFLKQGCFLILGLLLTWIVTKLPSSWIAKYYKIALLLALCPLVLVFVPGIGHTVNGSARWLTLGILNFHASEVAKLFFIVYLTGYLLRHEDTLLSGYKSLIRLLLILSVFVGLLLLEPDLGTAIVLCLTTIVLLFVRGVRLRYLFYLFFIFIVFVSLVAFFSPYRWQRIVAFMDPWRHHYDSGYQLIQAFIAFGRGGASGVGLGNSLQKLFYLPESHTDFVLAVLGEEFGFIGLCFLFFVYFMLLFNCLQVAKCAEKQNNRFSSLLVYGIVYSLCLQILISAAVNLGLCPTKGLTLPFISYGGTSLIMNCLAIGIVLRIAKENKQKS